MRYSFEYFFIPDLVNNSNQENDDFVIETVELFNSFQEMRFLFEQFHSVGTEAFDWDDLTITKILTNEMEYLLFKFPKPRKEPEALWGIITHPEMDAYRYFTFEMGRKGSFNLCEITAHEHTNYGIYTNALTESQFVDVVLDKLGIN